MNGSSASAGLRPLVAAVVLSFALPLGGPPPASGYQLVGGTNFRWPAQLGAVPYWVANRGDNRMSVAQVVAETRTAMNTWDSVAQADVALSYQGLTNQRPFDFFDRTNTIGFSTREHLRELGLSEATLAVTSWLNFLGTGHIAESDILVNPAFDWTDAPERGGWDYRSLLVHEIGHFLGLGHSNVGRDAGEGLLVGSAVMWPYSFGAMSSLGRTLTDDDIAGVSFLYPGPQHETGVIRGVVRREGDGVSHAHVMAFEPQEDYTVGAWADATGRFEIGGLVPGRYVVRVNPMPDTHPAGAYFFSHQVVDRDFSVTILPRLVVVRRDEATEVEIEVRP